MEPISIVFMRLSIWFLSWNILLIITKKYHINNIYCYSLLLLGIVYIYINNSNYLSNVDNDDIE